MVDPVFLTLSRPGWFSPQTRYSALNSFHLEISHCDASRARMSLRHITVTNLSVKTAKVGQIATKSRWNLGSVKIEPGHERVDAHHDVILIFHWTVKLSMSNIISFNIQYNLPVSPRNHWALSSNGRYRYSFNPYVAGYDSHRPEISSTFVAMWSDFCSFHLEISKCDATRALSELESHHSY